MSTADGEQHLWAQRLDRVTKRPLGEPFVVYRPRSGYSIQSHPFFGPGVGPDRFIFTVYENTGNIWLAE